MLKRQQQRKDTSMNISAADPSPQPPARTPSAAADTNDPPITNLPAARSRPSDPVAQHPGRYQLSTPAHNAAAHRAAAHHAVAARQQRHHGLGDRADHDEEDDDEHEDDDDDEDDDGYKVDNESDGVDNLGPHPIHQYHQHPSQPHEQRGPSVPIPPRTEHTALLVDSDASTAYGSAGIADLASPSGRRLPERLKRVYSRQQSFPNERSNREDAVRANTANVIGTTAASKTSPLEHPLAQHIFGGTAADPDTFMDRSQSVTLEDDEFPGSTLENNRAGAILGAASFAVIGVVTAVVISGLLAWFETLWEPQFTVYSDWVDKGDIPLKYGCRAVDGPQNAMSIPLRWANVPESATSLILLVANPGSIKLDGTDPVHWFVTNMSLSGSPSGMHRRGSVEIQTGNNPWMLKANASFDRALMPFGAIEHAHRWNANGMYQPMCSPPNVTSLYIVYLYAVDKDPEIAMFTDARRIMNRLSGVPTAKLAGYYPGAVF